MKKALTLFVTLLLLHFTVDAQKLGLNLNVQAFEINQVSDAGNANSDVSSYEGTISFSGNLRFYTPSKWAYRFGAGWENIEYSIDGGLETDYKAKRNNYTAIFGLEKHFNIAIFDIYPGVYIPITYKGQDDIITQPANYVLDGISNGDFHAGLALMSGVSVKLLGFMRVGAEFNLGYEQFKQQVIDQWGDQIQIKNLGIGADFVIGVAF